MNLLKSWRDRRARIQRQRNCAHEFDRIMVPDDPQFYFGQGDYHYEWQCRNCGLHRTQPPPPPPPPLNVWIENEGVDLPVSVQSVSFQVDTSFQVVDTAHALGFTQVAVIGGSRPKPKPKPKPIPPPLVLKPVRLRRIKT